MKIYIAPTVQQGGAWTIQQSIYLTHHNPCGENLMLHEEIGLTEITYHEFIAMLTNAMEQPDIVQSFLSIQNASNLYDQDPTPQNRMRVKYLIYMYALALYEYIEANYEMEGYYFSFTCYEASGNTIFDSKTKMDIPGCPKYWQPIYEVAEGVYEYTPLDLVTPNNFSISTCNLYGIVGKPGYFPYIKSNTITAFGDQTKVLNSAFLINQMSFGESVMAIASIIVDPANTRVYGESLFGISDRTSEHGNLGYNVCYIQTLRGQNNDFTYRFFQNISDNFIIRLTMNRKPDFPLN